MIFSFSFSTMMKPSTTQQMNHLSYSSIFSSLYLPIFSFHLFLSLYSILQFHSLKSTVFHHHFYHYFSYLFSFDAFALFLLPSIIAEAVFIFLPLLRVENLLSKLLIRSFANIDILRLFPITLFLCSSIFCFLAFALFL